jgi:putative SOS response-associated peptidase YedK
MPWTLLCSAHVAFGAEAIASVLRILREPFAKRRCLVPASGLYEWPKEGHAISPTYTSEPQPVADEAPAAFGDLFGASPPDKPAKKMKAPKPVKRVFAITLTEPGPFAFAGIWDSWKRPDGTRLETFALVTTGPNELVAQIHDRLALILHPGTTTAGSASTTRAASRAHPSTSSTPTTPG